jgi:hypothetical protein
MRLSNHAMAWKMLYEIGIVWGAGMASPFERNKYFYTLTLERALV